MAKLSEFGPFRPTPGGLKTIGAAGYISVKNQSRGAATEWAIGALKPTAPDQQTGQVYNKQPTGTGKIRK